jgi:hypothetical protein
MRVWLPSRQGNGELADDGEYDFEPRLAGGNIVEFRGRNALAMAAALIVSGVATVAAAHDRLVHPPIHVVTPTGRSPITPYFFPYGGRYRYNSPGPVYEELDYSGPQPGWGPQPGCRLWRYNYRYWVC